MPGVEQEFPRRLTHSLTTVLTVRQRLYSANIYEKFRGILIYSMTQLYGRNVYHITTLHTALSLRHQERYMGHKYFSIRYQTYLPSGN